MINLSPIFDSWPGMYLVQSFLHSLIAAFIVDMALIAWRIEAPVMRQRFRLIVIIAPLVSFPLYQIITPDRGSALFRLDALFDLVRWLNLEIWGLIPVGALFILFLVFTAVIFVVQEMLPIVRHSISPDGSGLLESPPEPGSPVARALESIPGPKPEAFILDDDEPVIFSSTGREPAVFLSRGLVETLSGDELAAALAHEIGHIGRSRRPLMVLVFLLRILMFYNPIILMEFRRIVQEEEKICDDVSAALTGNRAALAGALRKFYYTDGGEQQHLMPDTPRLRDRIEEYSHTLLIESRITRLEAPPVPVMKGAVAFIMVIVTILGINYFLV
jgi:Zn-dependent protease with chaperone function